MLSILLLIVLVLLTYGALPKWPYSRVWGYFPSGLAGIILLIILLSILF